MNEADWRLMMKGFRRMQAPSQIFCPDCGGKNAPAARFCQHCGRPFDDVREVNAATHPVTVGDQKDRSGRLLGSDGAPLGDHLDGDVGGERVLWEGRPSKLWSPRLALTQRYKLTSQRLIMTHGFIGRRTDEVDLYRVNDVGVKQHPLERITRIGDVNILSADTTQPDRTLHNLKTPDRVKDMIRESARQERQRRRVLLREEF
jgi:hypothetical protein